MNRPSWTLQALTQILCQHQDWLKNQVFRLLIPAVVHSNGTKGFSIAQTVGASLVSPLTETGFNDVEVSNPLVYRSLEPPRSATRKEILASPYEQELLEKGDETKEAVVADVEPALASYRKGGSIVIPQEANLFQAEKPRV